MEELEYKQEIERRIKRISFFKDGVRVSKDWDTLNCLLSKLEGYNQAMKELNSQTKPKTNRSKDE